MFLNALCRSQPHRDFLSSDRLGVRRILSIACERRGSQTCILARMARTLLNFLREYDFETLYIVGDLIDIWSMRRGRYWPQQHNDVVQKILRKARKGTQIVYIPGNHDDPLAQFYGAYGNITVQKRAIHRLESGQRM